METQNNTHTDMHNKWSSELIVFNFSYDSAKFDDMFLGYLFGVVDGIKGRCV